MKNYSRSYVHAQLIIILCVVLDSSRPPKAVRRFVSFSFHLKQRQGKQKPTCPKTKPFGLHATLACQSPQHVPRVSLARAYPLGPTLLAFSL